MPKPDAEEIATTTAFHLWQICALKEMLAIHGCEKPLASSAGVEPHLHGLMVDEAHIVFRAHRRQARGRFRAIASPIDCGKVCEHLWKADR